MVFFEVALAQEIPYSDWVYIDATMVLQNVSMEAEKNGVEIISDTAGVVVRTKDSICTHFILLGQGNQD